MFPPPQLVQTEVFSEVPKSLRKANVLAKTADVDRFNAPEGCFLEGPSFDRAGNLYVVDTPYGRIFRISPEGRFDVVAEYDGEPNGLCIHIDGRIFVADHIHGIMLLDPDTGRVTPYLTRYHRERFKGVNDLTFASNGDLYFTDQGQSDLADPSGRVYRYSANGLHRIAERIPSPNGLVLNSAENTLFVAVTRANAVWQLPLLSDGTVGRMGLHIQLSGGRGPDGMAMNEQDGLVIAHQDVGAVWIFSHIGEPLYRVQSCCRKPHVTNVAFGGPERNCLYITDSANACILRATVQTAGRILYSHM